MPMRLEGGCRCGSVGFSVCSHAPYPYQLCYCTVCCKTAGGGGYAINLSADAATLVVRGQTTVFHAEIDGERSPAERHFCPRCATALWLHDERWPHLLHPFASAIDARLPRPPSRTHIGLAWKAGWVVPEIAEGDLAFDGMPDQSVEAWHRARGLWID